MILTRYIWKELVFALSAMLALLLVVYISNSFVNLLADAAAGRLGADLLLLFLALQSFESLEILVPLAFYLAILVALGRLYRDNEMTVMNACGIGPIQVARVLLVPLLVVTGIVAASSLYLAPWSAEQAQRVKDRLQGAEEPSGIGAGRFTDLRSSGLIIYVEKHGKGGLMHKVFIQGKRADRLETLAAETAYQYTDAKTGDRFFVLRDGYRYEGQPGEADFRIVRYAEHAIRISQPPVVPAARKRQARPTIALLRSGDLSEIAELQRRFSAPIAVILLTFLAVPLSRTTPRQGRPAKLLMAVLVYIIYSNLISATQSWVEQGKLNHFIGAWSAHAAMAGLVTWLWVRQLGPSWVWRRLRARA